MGKLYDEVKERFEKIKKYSEDEKVVYMKCKTFPKAYEDLENIIAFNTLIGEINNNASHYFQTEEKFREFIDKHREYFSDSYLENIPYVKKSNRITEKLSNYEKIIDDIEKEIGEEKTLDLIAEYKYKLENRKSNYQKPLIPFIDGVKNELDTILKNDASINKEQLIEDLDYLGNHLFVKEVPGPTEDLIEDVSVARQIGAKANLGIFADEHNVNPQKLNALAADIKIIEINVSNEEDVKLTKPIVNEVKVSNKFKAKVLDLDKFITDLGIPSTNLVGESDIKAYGLVDYFKIARETTDIMGKYQKSTDPLEKKEFLQGLSFKRRQLEDIENKYEQIFKKIESSFDLNKISLNGNLYSGRKYDFDEKNIGNFLPNLPQKWDEKNAAPAIILSGLCQLKGAASKAGVTLEEYLDKPVESFLNNAEKLTQDIFKNEYRTRQMPLGKRLAHAFLHGDELRSNLDRIAYLNRGIEFITNTEDFSDNTLTNVIGANIGMNYFRMFDRTADKMFLNGEEPSYYSIKNVFAGGELTDNLYELSENYYNVNIEKGPTLKYEHVVKDINGNYEAKNENDKLLKNLKDYLVERTEMNNHVAESLQNDGGALVESVPVGVVFMGAKKYYDDFIKMNNKDLFSYDDKTRNALFKFMKDPVQAFVCKFKGQMQLSKQTIRDLKACYKEENDRINALNPEKFRRSFEKSNHMMDGFNVGKSVQRIISDNKGGWGEWLGRTTSKQYKALISAMENAQNPQSPTYGDYGNASYFAQKYIEHKMPAGVKFEDLKPIEKKRIEFSISVINACKDMEKTQNEIRMDNNIINNEIDNDFHNQLEDDVNYLNKQNPSNQIKEEANEEEINTNSNNIIKDDNEIDMNN